MHIMIEIMVNEDHSNQLEYYLMKFFHELRIENWVIDQEYHEIMWFYLKKKNEINIFFMKIQNYGFCRNNNLSVFY